MEQAGMRPQNDSPSSKYTIGDLAALYGVSHRTLRFYEERELLRPERKGSRRMFSDKDRIRLEIIMLAKRLGFSLADIWELIQSRTSPETCDPPASIETLGLTKSQILDRAARLTRERDRVQRAIEELREAAARGDVVLPRTLDARGDRV